MGSARWIDRYPRWRWVIWGTLLVLTVALLAGVDFGVRRALAELWVTTGEARWIWDEAAPSGRDRLDVPADPAAFYARDDFNLTARPDSAELQIVADEEYLVWINGAFVGAAAYGDNDRGRIDVYDVASALVAGRNRIVVEVRSRRSVGGLLCRLHSDGETWTASGEEWRTESRYADRFFEGLQETDDHDGEPAYVWSRPPVGRWGYPREERSKSPLFESLAEAKGVPAEQVSRRDSARWRPIRRGRPLPKVEGDWVTFDWGQVVEGHLGVRRVAGQGEGEPARALILFGLEPPDARRQAAGEEPADDVALFVPDSPYWLSARPRRFRYATVLGLSSVADAEVYRLPEGAASDAPTQLPGAFGLEAPLLRTSVEHEVRRELENVLGVAAR